jgi:hypothetical protein
MGQSTDAILFYGFCWTEETNAPWNIGKDYDDHDDKDDGDWEKRFARLKGLKDPDRPFPNREVPRTRENGYDSTPKDYSAAEQAIIDEHRASWAAKRELVATSTVEVETHCSGECPMPLVAVKASKTKAWRGNPMEITSLDVKPEWDAELRGFCDLMGIDVKDQAPKWWLVSDWT